MLTRFAVAELHSSPISLKIWCQTEPSGTTVASLITVGAARAVSEEAIDKTNAATAAVNRIFDTKPPYGFANDIGSLLTGTDRRHAFSDDAPAAERRDLPGDSPDSRRRRSPAPGRSRLRTPADPAPTPRRSSPR